jgi:ABC-type bacteriocin/lantibiotic exporter with double-glycine peptidase domain
MTSNYDGRATTPEATEAALGSHAGGANALELPQAAGDRARMHRGRSERRGDPAGAERGDILWFDANHFVVFHGADRDAIQIVDPAIGHRTPGPSAVRAAAHTPQPADRALASALCAAAPPC